jgi:hypothetical protein
MLRKKSRRSASRQYVPIVAAVCGVIVFFFMIFVAHNQKKTRWMLRQGLQVLRCLFPHSLLPVPIHFAGGGSRAKSSSYTRPCDECAEAMESRAMDTPRSRVDAAGHERYINIISE